MAHEAKPKGCMQLMHAANRQVSFVRVVFNRYQGLEGLFIKTYKGNSSNS